MFDSQLHPSTMNENINKPVATTLTSDWSEMNNSVATPGQIHKFELSLSLKIHLPSAVQHS